MSLNIITVTLNMGESREMTLSSTCYVPHRECREIHDMFPSLKELSFISINCYIH